jgi:hypothetical protein
MRGLAVLLFLRVARSVPPNKNQITGFIAVM